MVRPVAISRSNHPAVLIGRGHSAALSGVIASQEWHHRG
jgi:hypothetical protein